MATHIEQIKEQYREVANKYLATFLDMFDWDSQYGFWIDDDVFTGIYCYSSYYIIDFVDIMYIVNNCVEKEDFDEWYDYTLWTMEYDLPTPDFHQWMNGFQRMSPEEMEEYEMEHPNEIGDGIVENLLN